MLRSVLDPSGREVARAESPFSLPAGQNVELEHRLTVALPSLWSVEAPNLYTLRSEIFGRINTADVATTTFGIRTIAYDKDKGFLLNGQRVKMRGVNLHHDAGGSARRCRSGSGSGGSSCSRRWGRMPSAPA